MGTPAPCARPDDGGRLGITQIAVREAAMTDKLIADSVAAPTTAPYSSLIQKATGVCLVLAAVTNGLSQYVSHLVIGDREWIDQIRWGADHLAYLRAEQLTLIVSALFMPLGLLGIAQVTRWSSRRLTLVGTPLMLWGMWGFHSILTGGYIFGAAAIDAVGKDGAVELNEGLMTDAGAGLVALLPHLLGSLLGITLLTVAAWRSGAFPRSACALVLAFLVWDYFLPPVGALEAHLLLFVGWMWLGVAMIRMPHRVWSGGQA
jgi:hypothetical protein